LTLDELRKKLLYNDLLDVWLSFCDEKGLAWSDRLAFDRFLIHLQSRGVVIKELGVCVPEEGRKGEFLKIISDGTASLKTRVIRLDEKAVAAIRSFNTA
jgi:hypothetical protein